MRIFNNILITGGAGFIGSNLISYILKSTNFTGNIINVDKLTYAGNLKNLASVENDSRYKFIQADICDFKIIDNIFTEYKIDCVIHLAAESHVDKSISGPASFIATNINGTFNLLEVARNYWRGRKDVLFYHISTDEVFGSLGPTGYFTETTAYSPRSPYSASKAASDHLVMAYYHTYNLPVVISNCSNNYGPHQYPEKLIPLMIKNILNEKSIPVYGDGKNIRDWLYVEDHCVAIWKILTQGQLGESYNVGGENEKQNIDLVNIVCEIMAKKLKKDERAIKSLITYVDDRLGHDRRYAIDASKLNNELGFVAKTSFEVGIEKTVDWYLDNQLWCFQ